LILTLSAVLALAQQCAPTVAPETLLSVAKVESGFDALVVAVNGQPRRVFHPRSPDAAVALATRLAGEGASVDLGLAQINSRNLGRLGLTVAQAFDPCRSLAAAAQVLQDGYLRAAAGGDDQLGVRTALSFYNTGDASRGFRNGYVARVTKAAAVIVPALQPDPARRAAPQLPPAPPTSPPDSAPPPWDVFARSPASAVLVF
jgi:type IV secretion system protein VirB1